MVKILIDFEVNKKLFKVFKLHGDGQCSCAGCEEKKGFNRIWTEFCYEYKGKVYCVDCLKEVLLNENSNHRNFNHRTSN